MIRTIVSAVTATCGLLVMAACAGSTGSSNTGPSYYLHVGRNLASGGSIAFLQWGAPGANGQITGTLTMDDDSWNPPSYSRESIGVTSVPFTGQIHGTSITLHLQGKLSSTFVGTVANGTVTLSAISANGFASSLTFRRATTAQYNAAVTEMRQAIKSKCASASGC